MKIPNMKSRGQTQQAEPSDPSTTCVVRLLNSPYGRRLPVSSSDPTSFIAPGPKGELGIYRTIGASHIFYPIPAGAQKDNFGNDILNLVLKGPYLSTRPVSATLWISKNFNPKVQFATSFSVRTGSDAIEEVQKWGPKHGQNYGGPISVDPQIVDGQTFDAAFNFFIKDSAKFFTDTLFTQKLFTNPVIVSIYAGQLAKLKPEQQNQLLADGSRRFELRNEENPTSREAIEEQKYAAREWDRISDMLSAYVNSIEFCRDHASLSKETRDYLSKLLTEINPKLKKRTAPAPTFSSSIAE